MRTDTDWEPAKPGVITEDYRGSLTLIRQAARTEESEDVVLREFTVLGHSAALLYVDGLTDSEYAPAAGNGGQRFPSEDSTSTHGRS